MDKKEKPKNIIIMKVGPHSDMSLSEIIKSKQNEELIHNVHYWGYSGVFCQPKPTQEFCISSLNIDKKNPKLILIETKSSYDSEIGFIKYFSENGKDFKKFIGPVQLQGAQFSFVAKSLKKIDNFLLDDYVVVGGKNDGKPVSEHLKFRVNKCFAKLSIGLIDNKANCGITVLEAELVPPYCIWLKDEK